MVKEYIKKYSLYSAAYHEHQAHLLSQYQEKKKQIEEYLQEIKDVIIDDVRDSMKDRRQSIDACMTVTAPKTPGMTIRRTKRKIQEKKVEIDLNSPDTSISFANTEVQGSARFTGCTSRLDSTNNTITPTNTMTPNRTQSAFKQTRLQSLLEQKSVLNLTPTSGRATRLTRAKVKLLEQSLINSTINSMQSVNTPSLKTKLLDRYDEDIAATPSNGSTTPQNRTKSSVPHDESTSATPQNKTAVGVTFALGATPIQEESTLPTQEESGTPTQVEFPAANSTMMQPGTPAANSTMMQPGTPAAPFGANITLITNTPKQSTPVAGKAEALVVSSPIGPIATSGTPTRNQTIDTDKNTSDWVVSTGKRKFSNGKSTVSTPSPATTPRGTPGPASTPVIKRLQLSTYQPSPVPIATPAEKAPALLSLTIPGTPTPENASASLFPSPVEEVGTLPGTPRLEGNRVSNPDVTRTPNMNDIQTPGALGRTPGLSRVKQVLGTLSEVERGRSGDDLVFLGESAENNDDEVEVGLGEVEDADGSESNGVVDEEKVEIPVITHEEEKVSIDERPEENEDMETCENVESESEFKSTEIIDGDTSMRSDPDQKNVSMASEETGNVHTYEKTESETEPEAMDVAEIPKTTDDNTNAPSEKTAPKFFESPKVVKEEVNLVTNQEDSGDKETVSSEPELQTDNLETKTDTEMSLEEELQAAEVGEGNESNQLFESCDEGGEKESEVNVVEQFADAIEEEAVEEEELAKTEEEETPAPPADPKTPRPVRQTRSSRNKKHAESKQKTEEKVNKPKRVGVDKKAVQSGGIEVEEGPTRTRTRTRTRSGKESDEKSTSTQGTVKKIAADYENISKKTVKEAGISRIPTLSSKNQARDERLDMSKREREESEADSMEEKTTNSADESIHLKKRMKDNAGVPRNPQNLVTSVMSFVNKPVVVVKTAKELEEEKKEAAKKKIEEKEVKAQQVLNKKKQRENELRLKRIEKDKRMKQAKQNKEDEAKKKKADLEERMRKKDETSVKEREMLAKKEDEKRQREVKRQEQAEQRRKQAEKTRELKKKKLQEEAEERKVDALKRKQELEALKVRELEKHRMEEEARMEEQKKLEAEEHEKRQKAQEERRKLEEEIEKKKTTPSRMGAKTKLNLTGAGTLLGATPTPRPPPRPKHAASKIPTKAGRTVEEAVPGTLLVDLEEASNVCSDNEEVKKIPAPTFAKKVETSADNPTPLTKTTSGLLTPIAQAPESADSPSSAASSRIQSYMKNKLLSLGQNKTKRNLGSRMESISEGNSMKASPLSYDPRDNYKIDDIESGDDTDDESKPKRTMPSWARNKISLNDSLRKQFSGTEKHSAKTIFGPFPKTADLDQLFGTVNRYTSRTSSAHWSVPPSTGNLDFSILTEDEINHANNILLKYK